MVNQTFPETKSEGYLKISLAVNVFVNENGPIFVETEISIKKFSPNKTESSLMSHFDLKPTFKTVLTKKFYINLKLSQFTS